MTTLRELDIAMTGPTGKQRTLLSRLASITEMIEQHRATILLLELERMQIQTRLRLSGYRASAEQGVGE